MWYEAIVDWLPRFRLRLTRELAFGALAGFAITLSSTSFFLYQRSRYLKEKARHRRYDTDFSTRSIEIRSDEVLWGITDTIGNTPLIRINSLSDALGVEILGKAEYLNPGGSVKDRVALKIIQDAERAGLLKPHTGSCIFEGTSGSTGISFATIASARGYLCSITMPNDIAREKIKAITVLGAHVELVKPASIVDPMQFVNIAKQRALEFGTAKANDQGTIETEDLLVTINSDVDAKSPEAEDKAQNAPRGFFADQFETDSNYLAHFEGTGPEIWRQTNGNVDAFVSGAGTGGTIAGVGKYLKSVNKDVVIALSDPEGSGIHNKIKHGVLFDPKEKEGTRRRHQVDSIVEGIGLNRITKNLDRALPYISDSFRVTDYEAVSMSRHLAQRDGLFLGSSSACNLIAAVRLAKKLGRDSGKTIVTILCDSGARHYSKFWNDEFLKNAGIPVDGDLVHNLLHNAD